MEAEIEPKKQTAFEFAKSLLAINPEASFAEIKARAKLEGLFVYPVVYGRVKALLGLVPTAPYGSKSKKKRLPVPRPAPEVAETNRATTAPAKNSSRRSLGTRSSADFKQDDSVPSIESMISDLRTRVEERDRYRATLEKIAEMIQAELSE